jgi:hypothetical protein
MARRRPRVRRTLLLLLLLLLLALLLELNRWLPGTWPGGGGSGWEGRALPTASTGDPEPERDEATADVDLGATSADPAARTPTPEAAQVLVTVASASGAGAEGARLELGDAGGPLAPTAEGWRLRHGEAARAGVLVRQGAVAVRHLAPDPTWPRTWCVHLPAATPEPLRSKRERDVRLADRDGARPLAQEVLEAVSPDGRAARQLRADAEGRLRLDREFDVLLLRLKDRAEEAPRWVSLRDAAPLEWVVGTADAGPRAVAHLEGLPPDTPVKVRDADGTREVTSLLEAGGALELERSAWPAGTPVVVQARAPDDRTWTWHLDMPADGVVALGTRSTSRTVGLSASGELGPHVRARVELPRATGPRGDAAGLVVLESSGTGPRLEVAVPDGAGEVVALVDDGVHAPATVALGPDGPAALALTAGAWLAVEVVLPPGSAAADLVVRGRASVGPRQIERAAAPGAGATTVRLGPFPAGEVEVLVEGLGVASAASRATAVAGTTVASRVEVQAGHALRVQVSTATGLPVAGARVHLFAESGAAPLLVPDGIDGRRTDAWGRLALPAVLPADELRLQVEAEGFPLADVRRVRAGDTVHLVTLVP